MEEGFKQDNTNTEQRKIAAQLCKEEEPASHSEGKSITSGLQNGETESATSDHNYFVLEESVTVEDGDYHQLDDCNVEQDDHIREIPPLAVAKDYEDFVPSK